MKKKGLGLIKLIISIIIVCLFIYYLVVSPMMKFHSNEKKMEDAAKRYYEINSNELPTGERVKTLSLESLYSKKFLEGDFYVPYSNTLCNQTDSWVKVKRDSNGNYQYLVYLDCGVLKSSIDHEGPEIKLNGSDNIQIGVGEKFKDPGISSIVDNKDGKLSVKDVTVKGSVDTSKVGTYEINYIAFDSLKNKTTKTRTVKVVKQIKSVVKKDLGKTTNYTGNPTNNYVRLSNMIFRIYGLDSNDNIVLVAAEDIANVGYNKINKWLNDYYYKHLNDKTKDMIVKAKYCNMRLTDTTVDTTECVGYTDKVNVYIPSVVEVNKAQANGENFMKTATMSWVGNTKDNNNAYLTRNIFYDTEYGKSFLPYNVQENYGVRPMLTIKGTSNITGGNGTLDNPYTFGDSKKVEGGSKVSNATTGEYIEIGGLLYRVVDNDNGLKVISENSVVNDYDPVTFASSEEKISYNPTDKKSVAYFINNRINDYVDTSSFETHEIEVPIYKNKIIYGEEQSTNKYKAKLFAPNMFEMFSAQTELYGHASHSYWLINTSNTNNTVAAITDIGVPLNEKISYNTPFGVRVCAIVKSSKVITSGSGTYDDPYIIN